MSNQQKRLLIKNNHKVQQSNNRPFVTQNVQINRQSITSNPALRNVIVYDDADENTRGGRGNNGGAGQQPFDGGNGEQQSPDEFGDSGVFEPQERPHIQNANNKNKSHNLGAVLQEIEENERYERVNQANMPQLRKRDKVDEVFDMELDDNEQKQPPQTGKTAGELLDGDFTDTIKCFSFSNKPGGKNISIVNPDFSDGSFKKAQSSQKRQYQRNSLVVPETSNQDWDDSINQRVSNPSEEQSLMLGNKNGMPFKGASYMDSEGGMGDVKSGHFRIGNSPKNNNAPGSGGSGQNDQALGAGQFKQQPNYGLNNQNIETGNVNSSNEKSQGSQELNSIAARKRRQNLMNASNENYRSPNQKVLPTQMIQQKDIKPSILQSPNERIGDNMFGDLGDQDIREDLEDLDFEDSEASQINPNGQKRRITRSNMFSNQTQGQDGSERNSDMFDRLRNSDLNTSNIETEGQIGPSPNRNKKANLFATAANTDNFENTMPAPQTQSHFGASRPRMVVNNNNFVININQMVSGNSKGSKESQGSSAQNSNQNQQVPTHLRQQSDQLAYQNLNSSMKKKTKIKVLGMKQMNKNYASPQISKKINISKDTRFINFSSPSPLNQQRVQQADKKFQTNPNMNASGSPDGVPPDSQTSQIGLKKPGGFKINKIKIKGNSLVGKSFDHARRASAQSDNMAALMKQSAGVNISAYKEQSGTAIIKPITGNADFIQKNKIPEFKILNTEAERLQKSRNDNMLKDTPQSTIENQQPGQINSIKDLMELFKVESYNSQNQSFIFNHQQYNINVEEMIQDLGGDPFLLQRHQSKSQMGFSTKPLNYHGPDNDEIDDRFLVNNPQIIINQSKTPRQEGLHNLNFGSNVLGAGFGGPSIDKQAISSRLGSGNNSQMNLLPPTQKGGTAVKQKHQLNIQNFTNANIAESMRSGQRPNMSSRSALSALSAIGSQYTKTPLVAEHERKASRQRKQSKQRLSPNNSGSLPHYNQMNQLEMKKQNMTEHLMNISNAYPQGDPTQVLLYNSGSGTNTYSSQPQSNGQVLAINKNYTQQMQLQRKVTSKPKILNYDMDDNGVTNLGGFNNLGFLPINLQESEIQKFNQFGQTTIIQPDVVGPKPEVHLAFLFASPLLLKTSEGKYFDCLPPISFMEEKEQVMKCIEEKGIQFNYIFSQGTARNLQIALRENPVGLHFSGHGFQNNEALYQGDKKGFIKNKNRGDVLIFENENGASDFFFKQDLEELCAQVKIEIQKHNANLNSKYNNIPASPPRRAEGEKLDEDGKPIEAPSPSIENQIGLQFVYVASCHSEEVGKVFKEAGIPHVICINKNNTVLDKAAIEFSKVFYDQVFDPYMNICDAYKYAKAQVVEKFGKFQAEKILLLTNEKHGDKCPEVKDERLVPKFVEGKGCYQTNLVTDLIYLPQKVIPFVSRNQDMFDVLRLLTENNIIQIYGMPGLGKSSLLKNVTCFLGERDIYKDGVVYIDLMHVKKFTEVIQILSCYIKDEEDDNFHMSFNQDDFTYESQRLKDKIMKGRNRLLLSVDKVHHLDKESHKKFLEFLKDIVYQENVKVLFSSNKFVADVFDEKFKVKKIQKLKKVESVDLFIKKIPMGESDKKEFLDYQNIIDLHEATVSKNWKIDDSLKICPMKHKHSDICTIKYLNAHPLFDFLAGNPLVISIMAPLCVEKSLKEMFLYLAEKDKGKENFSENMLKSKMDDETIMDCLEYCTSHFEKKNTKALQIWYMIGLQGPGIMFDDLKEIYCQEEDKMDAMLLDSPSPTPKQIKIQEGKMKDVEEIEHKSDEKEEENKQPLDATGRLEKNLSILIDFSLIEQENLDKTGTIRRFRVSPFVEQYIYRKMSCQMKKDYLNIEVVLIQTKLTNIKQDFAKKIVMCKNIDEGGQVYNEIQDKIKPYESQILHIVQSMFKLNSHGDECDSDSEDSESYLNETNDMSGTLGDQDNKLMKTDTLSMSIASSKKSKNKVQPRPKSGSAHRDGGPKVSDTVKYGRSTVQFKSVTNKQQLQKNMNQFIDKQQKELGLITQKSALKRIDSMNTSDKEKSQKNALKEKAKTFVDDFVEIPELSEAEDMSSQVLESINDVDDIPMGIKGEIKPQRERLQNQTEKLVKKSNDEAVDISDNFLSKDQASIRNRTSTLMEDQEQFFERQKELMEENFKNEFAVVDDVESPQVDGSATKKQLSLILEEENKESLGGRNDSLNLMMPPNSGRSGRGRPSSPRLPQRYQRDRSPNPNGPLVQGFFQDREKAMGFDDIQPQENEEFSRRSQGNSSEEGDDDYLHNSKQKKGKEMSSFMQDRNQMLALPEEPKNALKIVKKQSSEGGKFENNIIPFEIAKQLNNSFILDEESGIDHLMLDEKDLVRISSHQAQPSLEEEKLNKRRQTKMFKRLRNVDYDEQNAGYQRNLRQSILDKSHTYNNNKNSLKYQLQVFKYNPDYQIREEPDDEHDIADAKLTQSLTKTWDNTGLQTIPENINKSAPPKGLSKAITALPEEVMETKTLVLQGFEELFFHFLSILAILPGRRPDILQILDTFDQRSDAAEEDEAGKLQLANFQSVERRLQKQKTIVEIPLEAKLLRANTMMLELFVTILDSQYSITAINLQRGGFKNAKYDNIYEKGHELRDFFEEMKFGRGVAIIDYVQAKRQITKLGNFQEFQKHLISAAKGFAEVHEIDGVQQCLDYAISKANQKNQGQEMVTEINEIKTQLETICETDEQRKHFIEYRKNNKIKDLSTMIVVNESYASQAEASSLQEQTHRVYTDQIYNMLLNPQLHHTIQYKTFKMKNSDPNGNPDFYES